MVWWISLRTNLGNIGFTNAPEVGNLSNYPTAQGLENPWAVINRYVSYGNLWRFFFCNIFI